MPLRHLLVSAVVAAASGFAHPVSAQAAPTHVFGVEDLSRLRDASPIAIDPAGKHVLYDVTYFGATGPEKDQAFLKFSPVMYAARVTTPLLILDGQADRRVPMLQGRELFMLMAEQHETVRMVTYPGSPHFPTLIEQRRNIFQEVANWLGKYNPGAAPME